MTKTQHLSFSIGIAEYESQIETLEGYLQTDATFEDKRLKETLAPSGVRSRPIS
ncbi:Transcriptional regulator, PadR family [Lacticaseibacillus paracasei]|nr:Transcriptional regulator, PadR family [Lacticaseibacillus paracasei]